MYVSIHEYGASVGNSAARNGQAIQQAIDAAAAQDGGTVYVPAGRFETTHLRATFVLCWKPALYWLAPTTIRTASAPLRPIPAWI